MPTQATIAITPGAGQFLDAVSLVIGANTVVRETMVIADPTNATSLAAVSAAGALKVDGSATVQPVSISGSVPVTQSTSPWIVSNSGTFAVQASITTLGQQLAAASVPVVLTAAQITALTPPSTVSVTQNTSPWIVAGALTHNNAAPSTKNIGALVALANAAAPTFTEGDQVLLSTDLTGALRVSATFSGSVSQNITQWNTVSLGSPTAYGTPPSGNVIGVNANVTTLPAVTIAAAQTIAVTNTGTFAVQATLTAETTKVIGVTRITGNIGGVLDAVLGATKPANVLQVGGNDGTNAYAIPLASGGGSVVISGTVTTSGGGTVNQGTPAAATSAWYDRPGAPTTAAWTQVPINCAALGANVLIAGVGGQTVRVMRMFFVNSDPTLATVVTIQDTTPTSFTGPMRFISTGVYNGMPTGEPLYISAVGKGIQLNQTVAVQLSGAIWYTQS